MGHLWRKVTANWSADKSTQFSGFSGRHVTFSSSVRSLIINSEIPLSILVAWCLQGDVESVASKSPKELMQFIEQISGSDDFRSVSKKRFDRRKFHIRYHPGSEYCGIFEIYTYEILSTSHVHLNILKIAWLFSDVAGRHTKRQRKQKKMQRKTLFLQCRNGKDMLPKRSRFASKKKRPNDSMKRSQIWGILSGNISYGSYFIFVK